jgi:coenzyme Q-binding protein COQ10
MMIGFKMFREKFTSEVTLHSPDRIDVVYDRGPFRYLTNHWRFETDQRGLCVIDFYIDFEFRSRTLQALIGRLFNEAVQRMVNAFARRAAQLHGSPQARAPGGGRPEVAASGDPPGQ